MWCERIKLRTTTKHHSKEEVSQEVGQNYEKREKSGEEISEEIDANEIDFKGKDEQPIEEAEPSRMKDSDYQYHMS